MSKKNKESQAPDQNVWYALRSFTKGLYDEIDKLAKKAPSSQLSDLATQRVNRSIAESKMLMAIHDPYVADLSEFVPAGENPEVRDAVLVLREILEAIDRVGEIFSFYGRQGT